MLETNGYMPGRRLVHVTADLEVIEPVFDTSSLDSRQGRAFDRQWLGGRRPLAWAAAVLIAILLGSWGVYVVSGVWPRRGGPVGLSASGPFPLGLPGLKVMR